MTQVTDRNFADWQGHNAPILISPRPQVFPIRIRILQVLEKTTEESQNFLIADHLLSL